MPSQPANKTNIAQKQTLITKHPGPAETACTYFYLSFALSLPNSNTAPTPLSHPRGPTTTTHPIPMPMMHLLHPLASRPPLTLSGVNGALASNARLAHGRESRGVLTSTELSPPSYSFRFRPAGVLTTVARSSPIYTIQISTLRHDTHQHNILTYHLLHALCRVEVHLRQHLLGSFGRIERHCLGFFAHVLYHHNVALLHLCQQPLYLDPCRPYSVSLCCHVNLGLPYPSLLQFGSWLSDRALECSGSTVGYAQVS